MLLIYGKGKSGNGVARLCDYLGIQYQNCDDTDKPLSYDAYTWIIPSPGVPGFHEIYDTGKVISELDFAYQFLPERFEIISITGTDGKSTTSWILYSILQKEYFGKKSVYLSGNFDIPFSETTHEILVKGEKRGIIVLEVSSFMSHWLGKFPRIPDSPSSQFPQLFQGANRLPRFQSDYSIFTNFRPDHLNWHKDLQEYLDAKMNLLLHTQKKAIINSQVYKFSREHNLHIITPDNVRIYEEDSKGEIMLKDRTNTDDIILSGRKKYHLSETNFSGKHNAMNILASTLVTNEMDICSKRTKQHLSSISGLPHRLEIIGKNDGVIIVEDSKSTSAQSLEAALGSFLPKNRSNHKNILLIAGGSDKGDDFSSLVPQFGERVKAVACIGATKHQFISIAKEVEIPYIPTDSLDEAVSFLWSLHAPDDILILSPGCASFGLFRDYLDRANQFREVIKKKIPTQA